MPPEGFSAIDHVEAGPWRDTAEDRALVAVAPGTVVLVESTFPGVERRPARDDGWVVEALEPGSLRDEVIRLLEAFVDA